MFALFERLAVAKNTNQREFTNKESFTDDAWN